MKDYILTEISNERHRQDKKWGAQNHHPLEWLPILGEEVGEVNKAVLEAYFDGYGTTGDFSEYRNELIQVAAVVVAMIECHDAGNPDAAEACRLILKECEI